MKVVWIWVWYLLSLSPLCVCARFLQEVGYEDIFNNDEVNEIKDLYEKAQSELTDSINQANSLHTQKLEEKLLEESNLKKLK